MLNTPRQHTASCSDVLSVEAAASPDRPRSGTPWLLKWDDAIIEVRGGEKKVVQEEIASMSVTPRCLKRRTYDDDGQYFVEEYEVGEVQVLRFGINTAHVAFQGISPEKSSPLHELEKVPFALASAHLQRSATTHNAAVFDFFVRPNKPKGGVETHSSVVLKADSERFLVVDGNNGHFCDLFCREFGVLRISEPYQCYKRAAGSNTGRGNGDFRDCVDVAVKIASHFLRNDTSASFGKEPSVALRDFCPGECDGERTDPKISCLALATNQVKMDAFLPKHVTSFPWRAGQSSDVKASSAIRACTRACSKLLGENPGLDLEESAREFSELLSSSNLGDYEEFTRQLRSHIHDAIDRRG